MFQSVQACEIFGARPASESHPPCWLAQLRKADWVELLKFANVKVSKSPSKQAVAEIALQHFEFQVCEGRADVWQTWAEIHQFYRGLVIQFRHFESNWSCGIPEFVDLEKNDPLGVVNIAGRLFCKVK